MEQRLKIYFANGTVVSEFDSINPPSVNIIDRTTKSDESVAANRLSDPIRLQAKADSTYMSDQAYLESIGTSANQWEVALETVSETAPTTGWTEFTTDFDLGEVLDSGKWFWARCKSTYDEAIKNDLSVGIKIKGDVKLA